MSTTKQASLNEQIKSGLRLSEAIKYCEDNPGTLLKPDNHPMTFLDINAWSIGNFESTWSVKLPPPKSVVVTRDGIELAFRKLNSYMTPPEMYKEFETFCKELGL